MEITEVKELLEWESARAEQRGKEKQEAAESLKELIKSLIEKEKDDEREEV